METLLLQGHGKPTKHWFRRTSKPWWCFWLQQSNDFSWFETLIMFLAAGKQWFFVIRNTDHASCCGKTMFFCHSKHWSCFLLPRNDDFSSFETPTVFLTSAKRCFFVMRNTDPSSLHHPVVVTSGCSTLYSRGITTQKVQCLLQVNAHLTSTLKVSKTRGISTFWKTA